MKSEPIQDFILTSERNLCIASAVGEAWLDTREKIISDFLDRLRLEILKHLKDWKIKKEHQFFIDPHSEFSLWKPSWGDKYWLVLQCDRYGDKMLFGVVRDATHFKDRPFCEELLNAVQEKFLPARVEKPWWEAAVTMRSPASDWRKPDVLWRIHTEKEFLDDVAEQFLQVAKAIEPIIDRLVEKK